jgi:hypothetical protein
MLDDKSLLSIVKIYATVSGLCGMGQAFVGLFQLNVPTALYPRILTHCWSSQRRPWPCRGKIVCSKRAPAPAS